MSEEIEAAAREMLAQQAAVAESNLVHELTLRGLGGAWKTVKIGAKVEGFFETGIGKAFADRLSGTIESSCLTWLTSDDERAIAAARAEARAAIGAITAFADIIREGDDARIQIQQLENTFGDTDE